jgi:hypothetical protein
MRGWAKVGRVESLDSARIAREGEMYLAPTAQPTKLA